MFTKNLAFFKKQNLLKHAPKTQNMRQFGVYFIIAGIGSILLSLFDMNFRLLMWIDMWGEAIGWAIRIGFIAIGAAILMFAHPEDEYDRAAQG